MSNASSIQPSAHHQLEAIALASELWHLYSVGEYFGGFARQKLDVGGSGHTADLISIWQSMVVEQPELLHSPERSM